MEVADKAAREYLTTLLSDKNQAAINDALRMYQA